MGEGCLETSELVFLGCKNSQESLSSCTFSVFVHLRRAAGRVNTYIVLTRRVLSPMGFTHVVLHRLVISG